ncbi:MAG: hypothetical protein FJ276_20125 [Planctomycetes bacterium]|nr:hypothetical protein [Planctomycetota bacterium]
MELFWMSVREMNLRQGDLLPGCWIPEYPADFAEQTDEARIIEADQADLIVITQTCDLEHARVSLIALCPVWSIMDFEEAQTTQERGKSGKAWRDFWNNVRKGRSPTLHLLASPTTPAVARAALIVDFRAIYSLPVGYLSRHAGQLGDRWRLRSPFLEHFSQALARSFMRVGLPSSVPEF